MDLSNYEENKILDHIFGVSAYTMPSNLWIALFESDPGEDGSGTETSYTGYSRVDAAGSFGAASGGSISNNADILFGTKTDAGTNTITHAGIFDASSGGNFLRKLDVNPDRVFNQNDQPKFGPGSFTFTAD